MNKQPTDKSFASNFNCVEELEAEVGNCLGISTWMQITQQDLSTFSKLTHDNQWIHTNPEKVAQESPFSKTIAHGFFILSLASTFIHQTLTIHSTYITINYGVNRVRFTHPVMVESYIRGRNRLLSYELIDKGVKLTFEIIIELKGAEKPACVAEVIFLYLNDN